MIIMMMTTSMALAITRTPFAMKRAAIALVGWVFCFRQRLDPMQDLRTSLSLTHTHTCMDCVLVSFVSTTTTTTTTTTNATPTHYHYSHSLDMLEQ